MIPNIDTVIALTIHMENILIVLIPMFILLLIYFIIPLASATIISTIEVITLKKYTQITQMICLVTNILILGFYLSFLLFIIANATSHLPEIQ